MHLKFSCYESSKMKTQWYLKKRKVLKRRRDKDMKNVTSGKMFGMLTNKTPSVALIIAKLAVLPSHYVCFYSSNVFETSQSTSHHHRYLLEQIDFFVTKRLKLYKIINPYILKLYCGYEYTKPLMIDRVWGLKQLWLQVNGHALFNLQGLCRTVRKGNKRKIQNENICLRRVSNLRPFNL